MKFKRQETNGRERDQYRYIDYIYCSLYTLDQGFRSSEEAHGKVEGEAWRGRLKGKILCKVNLNQK